jgi:hypothetical protein
MSTSITPSIHPRPGAYNNEPQEGGDPNTSADPRQQTRKALGNRPAMASREFIIVHHIKFVSRNTRITFKERPAIVVRLSQALISRELLS